MLCKTPYKIFTGERVLATLPKWINQNYPLYKIAIILDSNTKKFCKKHLEKNLNKCSQKKLWIEFKAGEKQKNLKTVEEICGKLFKNNFGRDTLVLAFGGGVTGDIAGFSAAIYMRGVPFVQIPTTLLAMVDSSIGGKTGVDTKFGKNLLGAFYEPKAVFADTDFLKTLPKKEYENGLIESLKMFISMDKKAVSKWQKNEKKILKKDKNLLNWIIKNSIQLKQNMTQDDLTENGKRAVLNWGHSVGHALEKLSKYTLSHGHAVGLGMIWESQIAVDKKYLSRDALKQIQTLLKNLEVNVEELKNVEVDTVIKTMKTDKKNRNGKIKMIMLKKMGETVRTKNDWTVTVTPQEIKTAYKNLMHTNL